MAILALSETAATNTMDALNLEMMMSLLTLEESQQITLYFVMLCHALYELIDEAKRPRTLAEFMRHIIQVTHERDMPEPQ